jgi:hypothetical protein
MDFSPAQWAQLADNPFQHGNLERAETPLLAGPSDRCQAALEVYPEHSSIAARGVSASEWPTAYQRTFPGWSRVVTVACGCGMFQHPWLLVGDAFSSLYSQESRSADYQAALGNRDRIFFGYCC